MNTKLKAARERAGKTQSEVAKLAHISHNHYQNIEYGKHAPSVRTAIRIAQILGTTVEKIF